MPRYFFHVHDGRDILDGEGTNLSGTEEARAKAVIASGEALKDLGARFWKHPDWRMRVTDEQGAIVCRLRFGDWVAAD